MNSLTTFRDFFDEPIPDGVLALGFEDLSWCNESAGHLWRPLSDKGQQGPGLSLWVQPVDPEKREHPALGRFMLNLCPNSLDDEGEQGCVDLVITNDLESLLALCAALIAARSKA